MRIQKICFDKKEWCFNENEQVVLVKNDRNVFMVWMETLFQLDNDDLMLGSIAFSKTFANSKLSCVCEKDGEIYELCCNNATSTIKTNNSVSLKRNELIQYRCLTENALNGCDLSFLPEYLFPEPFRFIASFDPDRSCSYTQEILNYWTEKIVFNESKYQRVTIAIDDFVSKTPSVSVGKYTLSFLHDDYQLEGEYDFCLEDSDPTLTQKEKQSIQLMDFITSNRLTKHIQKEYDIAFSVPLFVENTFTDISDDETRAILQAVKQTGRQIFIIEPDPSPILSQLCDKEITIF